MNAGAWTAWVLESTGATWNGSAATATALQTARTINGVSFNGTANITVADATKLPLAGGTMTGAITFAAGQTWPTFNQNTTGSAATLATARTLWGQSFNGSANISGNLTSVGNITGTGAVSLTATSGQLTLAATGDNSVSIQTNGVERLQVSGDGSFGFGTSPNSGRRYFFRGSGSSGSTFTISVQNGSATEMFLIRDDGAIYTGLTTSSPYNLTTGLGANVHVFSDGYLRRSTSSRKYKTDIQDATHGLAEVMALRPVTYKGISEADGNTVFGGLIAEEVHEAGLTEFVQYAPDGSPDALAYGNMVALLTKAIQEQQALIASLTTRVEALEPS